MSWGVPVPDDPEHVMYVWFDALVIYISPLGWPCLAEAASVGGPDCDFNGFWPGVQVCGKDNLRQQSAMWQAMLMAAELPNSTQVIVFGFFTGEGGIKMSKSLGNVVDPVDLVNEYGTDALRYFLLRESSQYEDSPFTIERFRESYNASLANGLGNLASRVMKMAETNLSGPVDVPENTIPQDFIDLMAKYEIQKAADLVWTKIGELDQEIQKTEPFKLAKTNPGDAQKLITGQVIKLYTIARMLNPLLPSTSAKIKDAVKSNKSFSIPLFPRLSV
jgi:methionyl-tRNA synthetase